MGNSFYSLLHEFQDSWPPTNMSVDAWLKTEDAIEFRRVMPSDTAENFPLLPDHCAHAGGLTVAGQCLYCGSFPRGNQFKRNFKK